MTGYPHQISPAIHEFDALPDTALVQLPVVLSLFGCSDETIRRRVKAGAFPTPVRFGSRAVRWRVGDLREALNGLTAANPKAPTARE